MPTISRKKGALHTILANSPNKMMTTFYRSTKQRAEGGSGFPQWWQWLLVLSQYIIFLVIEV